jgi:hypothetical protein
MKHFFLLTILLSIQNGKTFAQIDDLSFIGTWKPVSSENSPHPVYERVKEPVYMDGCFTITEDERLIIRKLNSQGRLIELEGSWSSLSIGHFDVMYDDHIIGMDVIQRFDYAEKGNENRIFMVGYEENQRLRDSRFAETYWKIAAEKGRTVVFEQVESLVENADGIYLDAESNCNRRVLIDKTENLYADMEAVWWNSENPNYFDVQYYNPITKYVIIEGFEILEENGIVKIKRTRFEEMRDE